tara:strand:+ start:4812 stop:5207 length:396 start_codon:yes stop_codon:yes gene_type:complete
MANIQALKRRLAQLQKKKVEALEELQPKKRRGRPPGSKNKKKVSTTNNSAAPSRRRGKFLDKKKTKKRGRPRIHAIPTHVYPDLEGVSLVVRKTNQGFNREWVACLGTDVIGYYKYQEDAHKAYLKEVNDD